MLAELIALRHGESLANVGEPGNGDHRVAMADPAVPLTARGRAQAVAAGALVAARWRPDVVVSSTYLRARDTADLILPLIGDPPLRLDERLRDREMGVLELLTVRASQRLFPEEVARRARVGQFFYRPPGGESMADVALRVRSVLGDLADRHPGGRVLVVAHDAVVLILRYVLEELDADIVWDLGPVFNGSLTRWRAAPDAGAGGLELVEFNTLPA